MAKKAKRGRPAKKAKEEPKKNASFGRGAAAVLLMIAGIVLAFGAVISAPVPHDFWHGAWWSLGIAAYIAPLALIYLGSLKFLTEDQRIPFAKIAGVASLLVFFAAWMHTAFLHSDGGGALVGGHGGQV